MRLVCSKGHRDKKQGVRSSKRKREFGKSEPPFICLIPQRSGIMAAATARQRQLFLHVLRDCMTH